MTKTVKRVTNANMRKLVESKTPFINGNKTVFAEWNRSANVYVVYSYGRHWPLYIYEPTTDMWFANEDKYSRTTSSHKSRCMPWGRSIYNLTNSWMHSLSRMGYTYLAEQRLKGIEI